MTDSKPHSAEYFNDQRDYWWNADYLHHLAARWSFAEIRTLLDVGCGVGHWGRLLAGHLAPAAEMVGVDREPRWAREAQRRFSDPGGRAARFLVADACALPFPDQSFDAVTCQTVLMHLAQPEQALAEMVRVLKPGGWIIAAEPNNLYSCLDWNERTSTREVEEIVAAFEFWLRYQRGKEAQGRGDNSLGERLPGLLARAGLLEIEVRQNDRPTVVSPPYDPPEQRAALASVAQWKSSGVGPWDLDDLRGTYLAGGGTAEGFERALRYLGTWFDEQRADVARGTYRSVGGSLFFLARGRKPVPRT